MFLQAVQENTRRYYWTGKITTKSSVVYEFGPENIVKGSGYICSQCCGSSEIELGTVYSTEMGITLLSEVDRYILEDALLELSYHLRLKDGSYEDVPMGMYGGGSEPDSGMDAGGCEYTGSGDHHGGKHGDGGSE